jgi:hypothetical protein
MEWERLTKDERGLEDNEGQFRRSKMTLKKAKKKLILMT